MRQLRSDEARRDWRDLLDEVQQEPAVQILRYDKPVAVVMSADQYDRLMADLEHFKPQPMSQRCRDGHHCGTGEWACVNCYCLCHKSPEDQEAGK
jgi:prevent-host-death family protein